MSRRPRLEVLEDRTTPVAMFGLGTGASANTLFKFDSGAPDNILATIPVTGLPVGETLIGIDFRPSNNLLYGVATSSNPLFTSVVTMRIDTTTGAAARLGTVFVSIGGATAFGVDVNPQTDEIRVVTNLPSDGLGGTTNNFRLSSSTGGLIAVDPDLDFTGLPGAASNGPVTAIAHSNNFPSAIGGPLYGIATGGDRLVSSSGPSPSFHILANVGVLGVDASANAGLDIAGSKNTAFAVLDVGGATSLYSVDLTNGAATVIGVVGTGATDLADVAIDPTPVTASLSVDPTTIFEGGGPAIVTVALSGLPLEDVSIGLSFSGTASKGADYTLSATSVSIPAGKSSATITVTAEPDGTSEGSETVSVAIETVSNATELGNQEVTIVITDNDTRPTVSLAAAGDTLAERNGTVAVTVTLSGPSGSVVTVPITFGGDATLDTDYSSTARQLVFLPGQVAQTFTIAAINDPVDEPDESIVLGLGTLTNATAGTPATVTLLILDDDGNPSVPPTVPPPPTVLPIGVRVAVGADAGSDSRILLTPDGTAAQELHPFDTAVESGFTGGARVAVADVNGDGTVDLIAGSGPGRATVVRVYDGRTLTPLTIGFGSAFEPTFTGGVFVAAGDVTGDGRADVVITPDQGGGPRVRVIDGATGLQMADFFGIEDPAFRGGARAAVGDVNGDGRADLIVAAGFGGGPRVAVFDGRQLGSRGGPKLFGDFFVFEPTLRNGVYVAAADLTADGKAEVVVGGGPGGGPRVVAVNGADLTRAAVPTFTAVANFFAGDPNSRGGVRVAARELTGDGVADLITGAGEGAGSQVAVYSGATVPNDGAVEPLIKFDAIAGFTGGVFVG